MKYCKQRAHIIFFNTSLPISNRNFFVCLLLQDAKRGTELDYVIARKNPLFPKPVYLELWVSISLTLSKYHGWSSGSSSNSFKWSFLIISHVSCNRTHSQFMGTLLAIIALIKTLAVAAAACYSLTDQAPERQSTYFCADADVVNDDDDDALPACMCIENMCANHRSLYVF